MTRTIIKGIVNVSADGDKLIKTRSTSNSGPRSDDRGNSNLSTSPLKFLDSNPNRKDPCSGCDKAIQGKNDAVQCDRCAAWLHVKCTKLTMSQFDFLSRYPENNFKWFCDVCTTDVSSCPSQDDRIAQQGAKIDTLLQVMEIMQHHMTDLQYEVKSLRDLTSQRCDVSESPELGNQIKSLTDLLSKKEEVTKNPDLGNQMHAHVAEALEEKSEREEKKNNVIMFRVPEPESSNEETEVEEDIKLVKEILALVHPNIDSIKLDAENVTRMGKNKRRGYTRPIKVKFQDNESKAKVFRNSGKLKSVDKFSKVNISSDKTTKELEADRKLKCKLDEERKNRPDEDLIIHRGQIIKRADRPARVAAGAQQGAQGQA